MKLYWVTTSCHHEDWFVYAWSRQEAQRFFENYEGYNIGDATARFIKEIPKEIISKNNLLKVAYAGHELLEELHLLILSDEQPRKVMYRGEVFEEGSLINIFSWPPLIMN